MVTLIIAYVLYAAINGMLTVKNQKNKLYIININQYKLN